MKMTRLFCRTCEQEWFMKGQPPMLLYCPWCGKGSNVTWEKTQLEQEAQ